MSMYEMLRDLRAGLPDPNEPIQENISLLDLHSKYHGTPDELPDREMKQHTVAPGDTRWGHDEELSNLHPFVKSHMPDVTHATTVYDPKGYILHNGSTQKYVHDDEPAFNHVDHELAHQLHIFSPNIIPGHGHWKHLHTDVLHKQSYHRNPNESAADFSNRIVDGTSTHKVHEYNDLTDESTERDDHGFSMMSPLEQWHHNDRQKNEPFLIGSSGGTSHHVHPDEGMVFRPGQVSHEFSHFIKVR